MTERRARLDLFAISSLLACCLLWGLGQVAIKAALSEITPMWQAGLRSAVAAALVWAWARWRGIPLFDRDGSLPGGLLVGALFAAEFACTSTPACSTRRRRAWWCGSTSRPSSWPWACPSSPMPSA